jgi:DNA invertase Pin-like site-specific DNA recombinase
MRVVHYARVSTIHAGQDPTMQTFELREYAARRGRIVVGEYVDQGVSGSKESRPGLNKLLEVVDAVPIPVTGNRRHRAFLLLT